MPDQKLCPGCRKTLLSRYNPEPVCGICRRAAEDHSISKPVWIWDTAPIRKALAEMNLGGVLALLRSSAGLTQQEMADLVPGWTKSRVTRIESGDRGTLYDVRELLAWADAICMPREALLPLVLGQSDTGPELRWTSEEQGMDRRTFNGGLLALTASAFLPDGFVPPSQVGRAHVNYLKTCADELWTRDWSVGGVVLLRQALKLVGRAKAMLDESDYSEGIGLGLIQAGAHLANCTSFLAFDAGDLALARRLSQEAATLSDSAEDSALRAHVYATMAMQSTALARVSRRRGPAREALRALKIAADSAKHHPSPKLHALIDMRTATVKALLGDEVGAHSAIGAAKRELDRGSHPDDWQSLEFVTRTELSGHEARVASIVGDDQKATMLFQRVLDDAELAPRNRTYYRAALAEVRLAAGDTTGALETGHATLDDLEKTVGSVRALKALRPLADLNADFHDRYGAVADNLTTKVASPT
ncbi:helix-turn-helix domain-containing protein [Actinomadura sp. BRA 177]|uniref:helix-turn-helix domain-containing protein n=1 Tax=Actinomadura sp. BRA 177 TaxID=2745202 RepID=UPI001595BA6E|nr:helix-turn-helix transcriptional regulator [Actinomadura sp. BRA 177]NVI88138.1 helix-turn-helix domain-containing protein [Actinomadura sp. BRA 177]